MKDIERNRSITQELISTFGRLDLARVCEIVSPDAEWWVVGQETAKRDSVLKSFQNLSGGKAITAQVDILDTIAEGDKVVIEWRLALEFGDGRTYRNEYTWIVTIQNSQVIKIRAYNNMDKVRTFFQTV